METDYWNSLDRRTPLRTINPMDIGISTSITKKGLDQLKARIFEGASNVELGFLGTREGKGSLSGGGITPEMHSKEEREEIRQLAKINEVSLTTHAAVSLGGISGLAEGGFRPEAKERAIHEIQRTVDFAADTAGGGPVVVHTGEFPRPISAAKGFEAFPKEEERAVEYLVDEETGKVIDAVRKDIELPMPVWRVNEKGEYVNEKGKVIPENERKPLLDKEDRIQIKDLKWKDVEEYTKKWNKFHPDDELTPSQWAYREKLDARKKQLISEEEMYTERFQDAEEILKKAEVAKNRIDSHEKGELKGEGEGELFLQEQLEKEKKIFGGKEPEKAIKDLKRQVEYYREGAIGFAQGAKEITKQEKKAIPLEKFGIKESADALARSAIYAYDKEKAMKLKKPLFVAPENIFPEQFGAHPQELKELVLKSREKMVEELTNPESGRNISKSEARKIADDHIKATFDVGHANTWKKYFKREPGESLEQADKKFKEWMVEQTKDLQKSGVLGHVHVSDNFGYYDEHLAPGEGNVPLKELAEKLKKYGYKGKFIAEWGAQPEAQSFRVMTGAWNTLASPVYKIDTAGVNWSDVEGSYFGRTGSPTYLVGDYAPSKDWTLWSETQLE